MALEKYRGLLHYYITKEKAVIQFAPAHQAFSSFIFAL
jgi:hypothetical protein